MSTPFILGITSLLILTGSIISSFFVSTDSFLKVMGGLGSVASFITAFAALEAMFVWKRKLRMSSSYDLHKYRLTELNRLHAEIQDFFQMQLWEICSCWKTLIAHKDTDIRLDENLQYISEELRRLREEYNASNLSLASLNLRFNSVLRGENEDSFGDSDEELELWHNYRAAVIVTFRVIMGSMSVSENNVDFVKRHLQSNEFPIRYPILNLGKHNILELNSVMRNELNDRKEAIKDFYKREWK